MKSQYISDADALAYLRRFPGFLVDGIPYPAHLGVDHPAGQSVEDPRPYVELGVGSFGDEWGANEDWRIGFHFGLPPANHYAQDNFPDASPRLREDGALELSGHYEWGRVVVRPLVPLVP